MKKFPFFLFFIIFAHSQTHRFIYEVQYKKDSAVSTYEGKLAIEIPYSKYKKMMLQTYEMLLKAVHNDTFVITKTPNNHRVRNKD